MNKEVVEEKKGSYESMKKCYETVMSMYYVVLNKGKWLDFIIDPMPWRQDYSVSYLSILHL